MSSVLNAIVNDASAGEFVRVQDILYGECQASFVRLYGAGSRGDAAGRRARRSGCVSGCTDSHHRGSSGGMRGYVHRSPVASGLSASLNTRERMHASIRERVKELIGSAAPGRRSC